MSKKTIVINNTKTKMTNNARNLYQYNHDCEHCRLLSCPKAAALITELQLEKQKLLNIIESLLKT